MDMTEAEMWKARALRYVAERNEAMNCNSRNAQENVRLRRQIKELEGAQGE